MYLQEAKPLLTEIENTVRLYCEKKAKSTVTIITGKFSLRGDDGRHRKWLAQMLKRDSIIPNVSLARFSYVLMCITAQASIWPK